MFGVGRDMLGVDLGFAEVSVEISRYTVRAPGGRPSCSGQPMKETEGKTEGDASNTVIVAHASSLAADQHKCSASLPVDSSFCREGFDLTYHVKSRVTVAVRESALAI